MAYYLGELATAQEQYRLPDSLRAELLEMRERFDRENSWPDSKPCIWLDLDTKQCKHYEYRPKGVCDQGLAVGDEACRRWRKRFGLEQTRRWRMVNGKLTEVTT